MYIQILSRYGRKLEKSRKYTCRAPQNIAIPAEKSVTITTITGAHSHSMYTPPPAAKWTISHTIIVGRKRLNEVVTEASGSSVRGNAVLRISPPPRTTELEPSWAAV